MRHNKKAQGLPLVKIVTAALVLLVLVVVAIIGPGMIKKGFNNLLCAVDLCKEAEGSGDYILRTSVEFVDEDHVILHFTPNPTRCAEIRETNPYNISQAYVPYGEDYIPEGDYEEVEVVGGKGDCGKEVLVPGHEGGEPFTLVQPDEYGTHMLRIEVYGEEQHNIPLEKVPVEVNEWERLLMTYLNTPMEDVGRGSLSDPYNSPISWSLAMHTEKRGLGNHPEDQSMNMDSGRLRDVKDILGLEGSTIEDIPDFTGGNFKEFLVKLGCAYPAGHPLGGQLNLKTDTMQTLVTAMFGDLQDFNEESGEPDSPDQPVPRIRDGIGIRGYTSIVDSAYKNQLLPAFIEAQYPSSDFDTGFTIFGQVRAHGKYVSWKPSEPSATKMFDTPQDSCFAGRQITLNMYVCPETDSACRIESVGGEAPEPEEPEPVSQDPSERGEGDCYVSSMDPCGSSVYYIEDGDWICMYDLATGVNHARHCEDGAISEVRECSCSEHACEMSSSLDESGWGCE